MKKLLLLLPLLFIGLLVTAQKYSKVKIIADAEGLKQLSDLGVTIDHGTYKQNSFFISDFPENEIQIIHDQGFEYEILIDDVVQYFLEQNEHQENNSLKNVTCPTSGSGSGDFNPQTPTNFNQGTMGGYLKYTEMLAELDAMAAQYPNLITVKAQISTYLTHENRPIYYVRMSDNPNSDESTEPKVLYTAIHHAREPMSMMETIFYMWYLLENYDTNEEVQYILNNMQLYFVPCINPDGYIYNETTNPSGGGMWRKNRRNNGGGVYGVDLNRNYSYGWGTTGTSTNPSNDTYCGPSAFSEPESQAMRWLVQNNHFISAFNAHTYAEDILFPIGTTDAEFADHHDYFQDECNHMVQYNGYTAMKSSDLYPASGDSDDYMYKSDIGVNQKDTMFVHTPEVGTAFWQPSGEIDATCKGMVFPNLVLAHITKKYLVVTDTDGNSIATMSGNFNHSAKRLGLEDGPVTVSIQPLQNIISVGASVVYDLTISEVQAGAISFTLDPGIQFGDEIIYVLETDNGLWVKRDTITKTYGVLTLQVLEDGSAANWTGNWSTTTSTYVSASQSYTDTPSGNYANNANRTYTYVPTVDLTNAAAAAVSFYAKWDIEANYDFVQFQVSTDGGTTWVGQCGNYTVPGTSGSGSVQPDGDPVYEGYQPTWVLEEINLSDYLGQTIKFRFQLRADGGQTEDGYYFDDFKIMYNEAGPTVAPTASFTAGTTTICEGSSVSFTDFSSDIPTEWDWNFGDGGTSTDQSPNYIYNTAGTYTVSLTVTNSAGTDTQTQTNLITVEANPVVTLASADPDNITCVNYDAFTLTASPVGATLSGNGVSGTDFDPALAGVGNHVITASYTDGNGCEGLATISISVDACASINENVIKGIKVHPNPNNGKFSISGLEVGNTIELYDLNGKLIYSSTASQNTEIVELKNIKSGVYYFQTSTNNEPVKVKIAIL